MLIFNSFLAMVFNPDTSLICGIKHSKLHMVHFDYFFQCGDDIQFLQPSWVKQSIYALRINNNVGLTGPD